ncbi:phosphoribosylglycinamide synthetase [Bifidobacterium aquikefiri]|uniref:phosphoribosylglycinamide synthetase n=1 Tax=Bifidobacterium aquikefiri TaxID=1653207 RepID=UPI0039EBD244
MNEAVVKRIREASQDPKIWLRVASERLSLTRYVFLVQIEDGIATAAQRASLEYADAVLIGWPEQDAEDVVDVDAQQLATVHEQVANMEGYIPRFQDMERTGNVDGLADTLIRITERVAEVRRIYQPGFPLPTFAEIRRVVQEEWDADMDRIDPDNSDPTVDDIERMKVETDHRHHQSEEREEQENEA